MKIALIKERKLPADKRVALSPHFAAELDRSSMGVQIVVESSNDRVFSDLDYQKEGLEVVDSVNDCDVLLGVKEVPVAELLAGKTYFFFSHTHKMQSYNRSLLQALVSKNIRMIDYECLEWPKGGRILGFGRWAGIVGVYNGFKTWGLKQRTFDLKPAFECSGYSELLSELKKVDVPKIKIALTGTGRVAGGALEVLNHMGIKEVNPADFLKQEFDFPVFTSLKNEHLYRNKDHSLAWDERHFYDNHEAYEGTFNAFAKSTDLLINGMYWEDDMPALFTKEETGKKDFRIKVIADITCDVEGSVPITLRATSIEDPVVSWHPELQKEVEPYSENAIDVMAVTNLPTELPSDASSDFGEVLAAEIIPQLINGDPQGILKNATLCEAGSLTEKYAYLQEFLDGH